MIKVYAILGLAGLMFSIGGGFYCKGFDGGEKAELAAIDQQAFDAQYRFPVQHAKHVTKHKQHSVFDVLEARQ